MSNTDIKDLHKELIREFLLHDSKKTGHINLPAYLGTKNKLYHLTTAQQRQIAKDFLDRHKDITKEQFLALLNALYTGESFNERTFGTKLLDYKKAFQVLFTPSQIYMWLGGLSGWCEVDSLCQSTFTAQDLLTDWKSWSKMLTKMSCDKSISRRRASLVLLCKPARGSADLRLADSAFANLEKLKGEKDILISKAVSWLLRALIKNHQDCVANFLKENKPALPNFVVKEVTNKLTFGKKTVVKA